MLLQRHPGSPPSSVEAIEVLATHLADGRLSLVFDLAGDLERVRIPPPGAPARTAGLWRHTCFETFVRPPRGKGYFEFNLAPSGHWAAYGFDAYRGGMSQLDVPTPTIQTQRAGAHFGLAAGLELAALPELVPWDAWQIGLSAVIEDEDGSLSYWALAHPPGKPDFHHPDCFVLELPPAI